MERGNISGDKPHKMCRGYSAIISFPSTNDVYEQDLAQCQGSSSLETVG